jgi:hypothetical protein
MVLTASEIFSGSCLPRSWLAEEAVAAGRAGARPPLFRVDAEHLGDVVERLAVLELSGLAVSTNRQVRSSLMRTDLAPTGTRGRLAHGEALGTRTAGVRHVK